MHDLRPLAAQDLHELEGRGEIAQWTQLAAERRDDVTLDVELVEEIAHVALAGLHRAEDQHGPESLAVEAARGEDGVDGRPADVEAIDDLARR